eukprot:1563701-Amphidinium_carterae.3
MDSQQPWPEDAPVEGCGKKAQLPGCLHSHLTDTKTRLSEHSSLKVSFVHEKKATVHAKA